MKTYITLGLIISLQFLCIPPLLIAENRSYVAQVKTTEFGAHILRDNEIIPAYEGSIVYVDDVLKTGYNGGMGLVFVDETVLTLGSMSEFRIKEYIFKPFRKVTSFVSYLHKGTASYIAGAIGRMNPDSVRIETPTTFLQVRTNKVLIDVERQ